MPDPADTGIGDINSTSFIGRQSSYDFRSRVFPEDLGQEDMSHYMVININVPTESSGSTTQKGNLPTGSILGGQLSKVDQLRLNGSGRLTAPDYDFSQSVLGQFLSGYDFSSTALGQLLSGYNFSDSILGAAIGSLPDGLPPQRRTTRIKESIALHMPNGGLVYTENNKYEEVSMTAVITGIVGGVASVAGVGSAFNTALSAVKRGSQIAGYPINPAVEVLFAARPQRQWMFEVFMLPRSENEVQTVKEIIRTLRYYAAPEITLNGFAFVPPADFDITFFQAGKENKNLPRINTCVIDRIDVDYSPEQSYSTFVNGHPTAVRLSIGFREVEILHKQRVLEGF
jgi:Tail-tube assembly protein